MKNRTHTNRTAIFPLIALIAFATFALTPKANADDGWETDIETAKAEAKAGDKDLLILFTGSDW